MKILLAFILAIFLSKVSAVTWSYQVNMNNDKGNIHRIDALRNTFVAGPHTCEVTPVSTNNNTEFRTLTCGLDTYFVSTGGLCTQKSSKFASVQYAILNMMGAKQAINVVVACKI